MTDEAAIRDDAARWDLFHLLRRLEQLHPDAPRIGEAKRARDEIVRAGQTPYLEMPTSTVSAFEPSTNGKPARVDVRWPGLMGPTGPLPLHLTSHARSRLFHARDPSFVRFCDVLQHRFIVLFYRAWAAAEPAVLADRAADRFARKLGALAGLADALAAIDDGRERSPMLASVWYLAGRGPRHPAGLAAVIQAAFGLNVTVREFIGVWIELPRSLQMRLDGATGLASAPLLGRRFRAAQQRFRIVLGPLSLDDYRSFLPGSGAAARLWRLLQRAVTPGLEAEVQLVLAGGEIPPPQLDGSIQLGFTSWLRRPIAAKVDAARECDADDLTIEGHRLASRGTVSLGT